MATNRFVPAGLVFSAASMISVGAWARMDPAGFAEWAGWPNHEHFLHDAGVFQIAIGMMLLAAVWWRDAVTLVMAGFVFTNASHAHNHFIDRADGGRTGDWQLLAALAAIGAVVLIVRLRRVGSGQNGPHRQREAENSDREHTPSEPAELGTED